MTKFGRHKVYFMYLVSFSTLFLRSFFYRTRNAPPHLYVGIVKLYSFNVLSYTNRQLINIIMVINTLLKLISQCFDTFDCFK